MSNDPVKRLHAHRIDELADSNEPAKRLHAARIDELADSNEPAMKNKQITVWPI